MFDKRLLYATVADTLKTFVATDEILLDEDPDAWQLVRTIDDWLHQYVDDPRVGVEQFERQCKRMVEIYTERCRLDLSLKAVAHA